MMREMTWIHRLIAVSAVWLLLGQPPEAREDQETKSNSRSSVGQHYRARQLARDAKLRRQKPDRELVDVEPVPWVNAAGERLVGVVESRTFTRAQLDFRVRLFLRAEPRLNDDPEKREDRRILTESRILNDWVKTTALAVCAEDLGLTATDEEVKRVFSDLSKGSGESWDDTEEVKRLIGIPERELRRETLDAILVDKLLRREIEARYSEREARRTFRRGPEAFLQPTRVRAWHIFHAQVGRPIKKRTWYFKEVSEIEITLKKLRKRLKDAENELEVLQIKKELERRIEIALTEMVWVSEEGHLAKKIKDALFSLEPGKTSKVIKLQHRVGGKVDYHIFRVIERKEGNQPTFEQAKPQIENLFMNKIRDPFYEAIKSKYDIYQAASGLNKWYHVAKAPPPVPVSRIDPTALAIDLPQGGEAKPRPKNQPPRVKDVLDLKAAQDAARLSRKLEEHQWDGLLLDDRVDDAD